MMAYIKLEDAINHIMNHTPVSCSPDFFDGQMDCVAQLKSLPTADVVEVCRCGKCKYSRLMSDGKTLACIRQSAYKKPTDFCSYGERKDA